MKKTTLVAISALTTVALAGCSSTGTEDIFTLAKGSITDSSSFGGGPESVWVAKAKEQFKSGNYGLAERYYRQAIEERHENIEAWLGLAASYDRLKQFDQADRAYKAIIKIAGFTPTIMNNLGFHYMLKGDFDSAERTLTAAREKDPQNPYIANNLSLLSEWRVAAGRDRG